MADVTISQLTRGTPSGNSLLPYSQGGTTLAVSPSALLQNVGNIGIGTSNPQAKLHIYSPSSSSTATNISSLPVQLGSNFCSSVTNATGIGFESCGGGGAAIVMGRDNEWGTTLGFYTNGTSTNTSGAITERMRINASGNVGVGTSNPSAKLDVNGSIFTKGYNHIESACLNITQATHTRLQNNTTNNIDNAYLEFGLSNNHAFISNNNIFEIITTAPQYGLKIKKSGYLKIDVSQDIISSTTPATDRYVQLWIYKNGSMVSRHLIRPTDGFWDNLVGSQILQIAENDIITMTINCHVNGYTTRIDWTAWSYYNFMFWS